MVLCGVPGSNFRFGWRGEGRGDGGVKGKGNKGLAEEEWGGGMMSKGGDGHRSYTKVGAG